MSLRIKKTIVDGELLLTFSQGEYEKDFYSAEAYEKLKEQRYLRSEWEPDYRPILGIDTDENGIYSNRKYWESVEKLKRREERVGLDRDPQVDDLSEWVEDYSAIINDEEALAYLKKTIRLLSEKKINKNLGQDEFEQIEFF